MNVLVWVQALTLGAAMAVLGWALAAGPLRIFSRTSRDVLGYNALVALAALSWWPWLVLELLPPVYRLMLGLVGFLAAVQWLCAGVHKLHDTKPAYVISPLMLPLLSLVMVGSAWLDASGHSLMLASFSAGLWMLGVSLQQVFPSLMAQTGARTARWVLAPFALAGLCWLVGMARAAWMLGVGEPVVPAAATAAGTAHVGLLDGWQVVVWWLSWALLNAGAVGLLFLKLIDKIRELSTEDEVTGALNMRSFLALLQDEGERLRRTPQEQSLLLCEVDQYAALNQQLGFATGDAALRHATAVIGRSLRKTDRLGRTPQGELVLLLPATPAVGATLVAERTQAAIKANPLLVNGQSVGLTLSMGVSSRVSAGIDGETWLDLCRQGVERARREGGARVRVARLDPVQDVTIQGTEGVTQPPAEAGVPLGAPSTGPASPV